MIPSFYPSSLFPPILILLIPNLCIYLPLFIRSFAHPSNFCTSFYLSVHLGPVYDSPWTSTARLLVDACWNFCNRNRRNQCGMVTRTLPWCSSPPSYSPSCCINTFANRLSSAWTCALSSFLLSIGRWELGPFFLYLPRKLLRESTFLSIGC